MGRSVSYLSNAEAVFYFTFDNVYDENGEYDEFLTDMSWNDMKSNLTYEIINKYKSYFKVNEWGNRETSIILQNRLCNIGISEYCGLVSLSIAPRYSDYDDYIEIFGIKHANQIKNGLAKIIDGLELSRYNKIGTFSNGESVYEHVKK